MDKTIRTKVVERGHGDGLYINTTGVGIVPAGVEVGPDRVRPGDAVLLSGTVGGHGIAVLSRREGLSFETELISDSAALHGMVGALLAAAPHTHALRDPTRGGLAAALNELAAASAGGIEIAERAVPLRRAVRRAGWWIAISAAGLAAGILAILLVDRAAILPIPTTVGLVALFGGGAGVYGAVTGLGLAWLLRERRGAEP